MKVSRYSISDEYILGELRREYQESDVQGRIRLLRKLTKTHAAALPEINRLAVEDENRQVRRWVGRFGFFKNLVDVEPSPLLMTLRSDSDPFVRACCLESFGWHSYELTMMFPGASHLERLALLRNPRIDFELIAKIFDPDENAYGIDSKDRKELALAFLTNERALKRVVKNRTVADRDFGAFDNRSERFLGTIWALSLKWPIESGIPYYIYLLPAADEVKADVYQKCIDAELRTTILDGCTDRDKTTLSRGIVDEDDICRSTAYGRISNIDPDSLEQILTGNDKAALEGLISNENLRINSTASAKPGTAVHQIIVRLRECGHTEDSRKAQRSAILEAARNRLLELNPQSVSIEIAEDKIYQLENKPR
jgi:hypothetical protein